MLKKLSNYWHLSILFIVMLSPIHAQSNNEVPEFDEIEMEELYGDEEFVSIATGSSKPVHKAPAAASVITAKEIERMGARTLDDVLETVPGLHVMPSALNRLTPTYAIRGINSQFNPQVLMLMNGIPVTYAVNSTRPHLLRLPTASIARIEIIRGPGSAVYGADAYAGVINIITKDAADIAGTEVGGVAGSFESKDLWLQHGESWGDWDVAITAEWQKTTGDKDRRISSDRQTQIDPIYSLAPGSLNTRYEVFDAHVELERDDWLLRLWHWQQFDDGLGVGGALALDPVGGQDGNYSLAELNYHNDDLATNWEINANLHYSFYQIDSYFILRPPQATPFTDGIIGNPTANQHDMGIDLVAEYRGPGSHHWRIGTGFRYINLDTGEIKNFPTGAVPGELTDVSNTSNVWLEDTQRRLWYLSLQDEWQFAPDWELTAGVRFDEYSDFGGTINPRLALVWATRYNLTTKLLYGRAFRAPSFSELDSRTVVFGNADLEPETIDTLELSFDYRPTFNLHSNLNIFYYLADGLIDNINNVYATRDQKGYGAELELKWDATDTLDLSSNFAWVRAEDANSGNRIADVPTYQLSLSADWKFFPDWNLHPQFNLVGGRKRAATDSRSELDDYVLVDMTVSHKALWRHWDFSLTIRNLFDQNAKEPSDGVTITDDYPLEGRSLWAAMSYKF